jgi:hypothetical protein
MNGRQSDPPIRVRCVADLPKGSSMPDLKHSKVYRGGVTAPMNIGSSIGAAGDWKSASAISLQAFPQIADSSLIFHTHTD